MDYRQQSASARKEPEYIAKRYRVIERLGYGGMAVVYRVFDEATNRAVALKLRSKDASESPLLASLFEREFHTLAQLAHPRIIEVYDYGVDERGAYYTMELLDGADLRKLAPMQWQEACKLLRDVASSLALLHSRRHLHRDISSRNVRCTKDGRAKLIDFGAMAPLGATAKVIGTPAFIAPEALNHQPLDQRTDLYALGALAYWLMTKRYAYRAHYMAHLHDAWRTQPQPLSTLNPAIPKVLNDLVMSLLSLDRMARPFCASEVVETLEACAGLARDDTLEVRQSYLTTPQLVGRGAIVAELRKSMLNMLGGYGGETFLFEGPSGIGRSRVLAELVLEGKVVGATVLTAGAEASARGAYGVAWELIEQLFDFSPVRCAHRFQEVAPNRGYLWAGDNFDSMGRGLGSESPTRHAAGQCAVSGRSGVRSRFRSRADSKNLTGFILIRRTESPFGHRRRRSPPAGRAVRRPPFGARAREPGARVYLGGDDGERDDSGCASGVCVAVADGTARRGRAARSRRHRGGAALDIRRGR
jgi:hypothetical protein